MDNNLREAIERICLQDITDINNIIATLSKKIQDRKKACNIQANALLKEEYQDD